MGQGARWEMAWQAGGETLLAREPTDAEIHAAAPELVAFYNEPHNRRLLANTVDLTAADVEAFYGDVRAEGGHPLLLWRGGALIGDADFRRIDRRASTAEFAILIGPRAAQGQGLGTRFATMAHAFAFSTLALARAYVAIVPGNAGSLRLFAKLGYRRDDSPSARACADDAGDLTLSVSRSEFRAARAAAVAAITFRERHLAD